jgi:hypothetical protein
MLYEPLLAHQMAKERMHNILRGAKQAQLVRIAEGSRKSPTWRLPIASALSSLLALFVQA